MKTKRNYKSIDSLRGRVQQLTLGKLMSKRVNLKDSGYVSTNNLLTDELINKVCDLLGGHARTKENVFSVIKRGGFSSWYLDRIVYNFDSKNFIYIAGQDYPAEIAEIRKDLNQKY